MQYMQRAGEAHGNDQFPHQSRVKAKSGRRRWGLLVLLLRVNAVMQHADGATCVVWTGITEAKTLTVEIRSQMVEASLQFLPPQVPNRVPRSRRRKHLECRLYRC